MTPEQMSAAVAKLLKENGYEIRVAIIAPGGLDITEAIGKQWGYTPVASVVKVAPPPKPEGDE